MGAESEVERDDPYKTVTTIAGLPDLVGRELGISSWVLVSQERVDAFADATGDRQWIHCDPERAARESPFGSTIAHGFLTISLASSLMAEICEVTDARFLVNPGIERLRLRAPVPTGSRLRMRASLKKLRALPGGAARATIHIRFDVHGESRPCAFGDVAVAYYP